MIKGSVFEPPLYLVVVLLAFFQLTGLHEELVELCRLALVQERLGGILQQKFTF